MVQTVSSLRGRQPLILPEGERILEMASMHGWVLAACTNGLYIKTEGGDWRKHQLDFEEEFERRGIAIRELEERLAALEEASKSKTKRAS